MDKQKFKYWIKGFTLIRLMAWPIENLRQFWIERSYLKSGEDRYLETLKNKHQGKRCFIIGNGPSLKADDLNKIVEEITFASNRIFYIYPETEWRPTYYISVDLYALESGMNDAKKAGEYEKFINYAVKKSKRITANHLHYIYLKSKFSIRRGKGTINGLSDDISRYFTRNATVTVNAIELAIYMGIKEIYLLGVDNDYMIKMDAKGKTYKEKSMKSSYFEGMKGNEFVALPVEYFNRSYIAAKTFAENKGVKIYNATRGGKLEVFERVDFDELMNQNKK